MRLKSITRRSEIARKLQIEQIVAPIAGLLILLVLAGTILLPTNDKMVVEAQPNIGEISVQPLFDSTISSGKPSESDPGKDFLGIGFRDD
ncbi:MAG: hypothetical protein R2838_15335 [Caldilineaceae bacterium]